MKTAVIFSRVSSEGEQLKYEQCPEFKEELERTKGKHIVELQDRKADKEQSRPNGWGVKTKGEMYVGPNIIGRLLMELRDKGQMEYWLPNEALKCINLISV